MGDPTRPDLTVTVLTRKKKRKKNLDAVILKHVCLFASHSLSKAIYSGNLPLSCLFCYVIKLGRNANSMNRSREAIPATSLCSFFMKKTQRNILSLFPEYLLAFRLSFFPFIVLSTEMSSANRNNNNNNKKITFICTYIYICSAHILN